MTKVTTCVFFSVLYFFAEKYWDIYGTKNPLHNALYERLAKAGKADAYTMPEVSKFEFVGLRSRTCVLLHKAEHSAFSATG